jgi:hypothetical protein
LCLVAGFAAYSSANPLDGVVYITVRQASDAVSRIELSDETGRRWSATANGDTPAVIDGLPPSSYHVTVVFADRHTAELAFVLAPAEQISIEASSQASAAASAQIEILDRGQRTAAITFTDRELQVLPTGSGVAAVLDAAAPFLVTDQIDTGGLALDRPVRIGSRAGSWTETTFSIGDFEVASAPRGEDVIALQPNVRGLEALGVVRGMAAPDISAPVATVVLSPKRPSSRRLGTADLSVTAPGMVGSSVGSSAVPSIDQMNWWRSGGLEFGQPVSPRVGLFVAADFSGINTKPRGSATTQSADVGSGLVHVIAKPADQRQFNLFAEIQHGSRPYGTELMFRNAGLSESHTFFQSHATWQQQTSSGIGFEGGLGYQHGGFDPSGALPAGATFDRVFDGPMPGFPADQHVDRVELRVAAAMPARSRIHAVRFGAAFRHTSSGSDLLTPAPVAELVDNLPARVWIPTTLPAASSRGIGEFSAYVSDHMLLTNRVTADVGLRLEHASGSATGSAQSITWTGAMPRVSLRWAPHALSMFVAYGQYQRQLTLPLLAFGDPGEPVLNVYRWNDIDGNGRYETGDQGVLIARAGRGQGLASIDPKLHAPRMHEFSFGGERRLGGLTLGASGFIRREHALIQSFNVGVPTATYQARLVPDSGSTLSGKQITVYDRAPATFGLDQYVLSNVPDGTAKYEGVEIYSRYNSPRWWLSLGASAYRTEAAGGNRGLGSDENDPDVIGELYENPNAPTNAVGRLFADRAYVLKWAMGFHLPHDIDAGLIARYEDGQPFSRLIVATDLAQGPEIVRAELPGTTRFTFATTIDARIEKRVTIGSRSIAFWLDAYNLTNLGNEVEENPVTGPAFRSSLFVQPPRTFRVGMRFGF